VIESSPASAGQLSSRPLGSRRVLNVLPSATEVESLARRILACNAAPAARLWLFEEVLVTLSATPDVRGARRDLLMTANVRRLASSHQAGKAWGRFHSADSSAKRTVPTTEFGVRRSVALRVPPTWPIFRDVAQYCESVLGGFAAFPDPPERNDRWEAGWRLFVASTLSLIKPRSPLLRAPLRTWRAILDAALREGHYDEQAEAEAHRALTGATVRGTYLQLDNRYAVELLARAASEIPNQIRDTYLKWLVQRPSGVRYLGVPALHPSSLRTSSEVDRWLDTWGLLSRFPGWYEFADPAMGWLWRQRGSNGRWDFGPRPRQSHTMPLADSWREPGMQSADWSSCALALLSRYCACR